MLEKLHKTEEYPGATTISCDSFYYIELKKGTTASDHTHNEEETIYFLKGKAEFTLGENTQNIKAPIKITIPPNTYHKFLALNDCTGIEVKNNLLKSIEESEKQIKEGKGKILTSFKDLR